jgi:membrane protein YqaA with SNARE-associated domain
MSITDPADHTLERARWRARSSARWRARNRVADLLAVTGGLALMVPALTLGPNLVTWLSTLTTTALLLFLASWVATKTARKYEYSLTELVDQFASDLRKPRR